MSKIRLLICDTCQSIEELPVYEGKNPAQDDTLNYRVAPHRFPDGNEHFGGLAIIDEDQWSNPYMRQGVIEKLKNERGAPGQGKGLGDEFYDVKNTFHEDALICWGQHNRTEDCADWRSDKKRLYPDTRGDRKELGLSAKSRPNTWLCDFCPVTSVYAQRRNQAKGWDK